LATAAPISSACRAIAAAAWGESRQMAVEASTSVIRKVTTPVGNSGPMIAAVPDSSGQNVNRRVDFSAGR